MTTTSPVVLVEDHRLLSQAVAASLGATGVPTVVPDLDRVASLQALEEEVLAHRPVAVWLDLDLAALGQGDALVRPLVGAGCPVLVVTGDVDEARWGRLLLAGAAGVLPKSTALPTMLGALRHVVDGSPVMAVGERERLVAAARRERTERERRLAPLWSLTRREAEVLAELLDGRQAAEIAARAVVSETTVRAQIRAILRKLEVTSQLQAVALARRAGWEGPGARG